MSKTRIWLAPLAVALTAAGCAAAGPAAGPAPNALHASGRPSPSSPPGGQTGAAGAAGAAAPAAPASPSADPPSPASGAVPSCGSGQLRAALGSEQGAAGHVVDVFTLTNRGTGACEMDGYPGITLLSSSGAPVAIDVSHGADMGFAAVAPKPVRLARGAAGSFSVGSSDVQRGSAACAQAAAVRIAPPGGGGAVQVTTTLTACDGLDVSPVVAGTNGAPS